MVVCSGAGYLIGAAFTINFFNRIITGEIFDPDSIITVFIADYFIVASTAIKNIKIVIFAVYAKFIVTAKTSQSVLAFTTFQVIVSSPPYKGIIVVVQ